MQENKINLALLWSKYGGNVTSVNDLILGLDKKRFNVTFIFLSGYGVDKNSIEEAGYKVFYLSNKEHIKIFRFTILCKLVQILKNHDVDVLHCHAHKATVYGTIAAIFAHTPVVISHVHGLNRSRNFRRKLVNFLLLRKVNRIIPVANSVKKDVLKSNWFLSAKKLSVLENSIDYKRFADVVVSKQEAKRMLGMPLDTFIFGTIGRLAPTKGLPYLIQAFSKVKEQIPSAHLVMLGDGGLKPELEKLVAEMPCCDSVHFLGYRTNIEALLRGLDVFVLSSVAEGMPRVILEAMAAGTPCIATAVGGIPEIFNNDENAGFLVQPKDSDALARAMIRIATMTKRELDTLIGNAQNRVLEFYSHQVVGEKLRRLYESEYQSHCKPR
ncbi:MAG: glycosyltransferase [Sedimentisphaerales bacterium]